MENTSAGVNNLPGAGLLENASKRDGSGRVTAQQMNLYRRAGMGRSLRRICASAVLGSLMAAGFLPILALAEEGEGVREEMEALQAKVASLQATVSTLQGQVSSLQSQLAVVQSNAALALGPFVTVDPDAEFGVVGPHITFKGANIHIVSGSGFTNDNDNPTGLGNLIVGYNEQNSVKSAF